MFPNLNSYASWQNATCTIKLFSNLIEHKTIDASIINKFHSLHDESLVYFFDNITLDNLFDLAVKSVNHRNKASLLLLNAKYYDENSAFAELPKELIHIICHLSKNLITNSAKQIFESNSYQIRNIFPYIRAVQIATNPLDRKIAIEESNAVCNKLNF